MSCQYTQQWYNMSLECCIYYGKYCLQEILKWVSKYKIHCRMLLLCYISNDHISELKLIVLLCLLLPVMSLCICVYLNVLLADCVCTGAGRWSQETEAGLQAGAGGGLHESGELRTALPRAHWEETPSETEPCLSEDLSPSFSSCDFLPPPFKDDDFFLDLFSASSSPRNILFSSSTLLHRLVYLNIWRVVQSWGWRLPQCNAGDPSASPQGELQGVIAWKLAILAYFSPPVGRKDGKKTFLCCLQEFTLKTIMLGVHFVENFFQNRIDKIKPSLESNLL